MIEEIIRNRVNNNSIIEEMKRQEELIKNNSNGINIIKIIMTTNIIKRDKINQITIIVIGKINILSNNKIKGTTVNKIKALTIITIDKFIKIKILIRIQDQTMIIQEVISKLIRIANIKNTISIIKSQIISNPIIIVNLNQSLHQSIQRMITHSIPHIAKINNTTIITLISNTIIIINIIVIIILIIIRKIIKIKIALNKIIQWRGDIQNMGKSTIIIMIKRIMIIRPIIIIIIHTLHNSSSKLIKLNLNSSSNPNN